MSKSRFTGLAVWYFLCAGLIYSQPSISGCPVFPANNIWNVPVDNLPLHPQSSAYIAKIGPQAGLRLDDAIPINVVSGAKFKIPVTLVSTESDPGAYVIPPSPQIEKGSDLHIVVVDKDECVLYELFAARREGNGWKAESGAKWDLNSNALRPDGWTSADAAGLPITAGVVRYDEVASGQITHALRFSAPWTMGNGAFQWPARHYASHHPDGPPMGQRFRLKANVDISGYSRDVQVILRALKKYGAMLADNGMPWGMQHDGDARWNAPDLVNLHKVLGSNMEAVDAGVLMTQPTTAATGAVGGMIVATDLLGRPNAVKVGAGLAIVNGVLVVKH